MDVYKVIVSIQTFYRNDLIIIMGKDHKSIKQRRKQCFLSPLKIAYKFQL